MAQKSGPEALRAWMEKSGASAPQVAEGLGISKPVIYGWLSGEYRPKDVTRIALERFTGGAVPASSWVTKEERDEVRDVQPFSKDDPDDKGIRHTEAKAV